MVTEFCPTGYGYEVYNRPNNWQIHRRVKTTEANLNNNTQNQSGNNQQNKEEQKNQENFQKILEEELGKNIDLYI